MYLRYPYAALAELIFGDKVKSIVTVMLDVAVFGACIPNLLIGKSSDVNFYRLYTVTNHHIFKPKLLTIFTYLELNSPVIVLTCRRASG